jgi:hypothetical protein
MSDRGTQTVEAPVTAAREPEPMAAETRQQPSATTTGTTGAAPETRSDRAAPADPSGELLLDEEQKRTLRKRWEQIQTSFIDEPRQAVADADREVRELIASLGRVFEEQRAGLERAWGQGNEVSTERLRVSLQRYRAFFERLLAI